ncbi:hypothetical protein KUTeg_001231 [Tegillarca granosa]|uniref:Zinc finger PHD-type domain-containing protein n=1 Tax=Tegillarca granosa TaxID=220873 RepID=A0ABQ9FV83_TEGGR|nr:hypothetical protein KUTeg_001266 [Tegillarca granosa]KAJ8321219.1 hypothetical protein KUTeg_001231 [Tegillarca granosa]
MVDILDEYMKYIPMHPNGLPVKIPLHADGLSCERTNDAQNARINGTTAWSQLQGFQSNIQEWHKRHNDDLYSGKSSRDRGTLFQLKHYFGHRNLTGNVTESFSYVDEFLSFVTMGYVTLAAMHFMYLENLDQIPVDFPQTLDGKLTLLKSILKSILDMIFISCQTLVKGIMHVSANAEDKEYKYCQCKIEKAGEMMIFCDNRKCPNGQWFHMECVNDEEDEVPEDAWFCSRQCKTAKTSTSKRKKTVSS